MYIIVLYMMSITLGGEPCWSMVAKKSGRNLVASFFTNMLYKVKSFCELQLMSSEVYHNQIDVGFKMG